MPRYFIDTFDHIAVVDDVGHDLPDEAALRRTMRETLVGMLGAEYKDEPSATFRAEARDEAGTPVLTATALVVITDPPRRMVIAA